MNESTFSALRIVALMMSADGQTHPKETEWFQQLIGHYGVTSEQREILRRDLNEGGRVEEIYARVDRAFDRERLTNWLKIMMQLDREIHPKEKEIYDAVLSFNKAKEADHSQVEMGKAILENEKETQLWADLKVAGDYFNHRSAFPWIFWWFLTNPRPTNDYVVWGLVLFVVLLSLLLFLLHFI